MLTLKTVPFNNKDAGNLHGLTTRASGSPNSRTRASKALWLMLTGLLLLVLLGWAIAAASAPRHLSEARLTGPRSPAPISVVLLLDESGSFEPHRAVRRLVVEQVASWAPDNLRADDTITVVSFAEDAEVRMSTTSVGELAQDGLTYGVDSTVGSGTNIQPALTTTLQRTGAADHTTSIIVVTDTQVADLNQAQVEELMKRLGTTSMSVIIPKGVEVTDAWEQAFPWQQTFHSQPDSVDEVAVAVGKALAHATGQRLVKSG